MIYTFTAKYNKGDDKTIPFKLSKGGFLLWGGYYVDTLMENAEAWLNDSMQLLCVDGGTDTCMLNMKEWVCHVLKNRHDIERQLKIEGSVDKL